MNIGRHLASVVAVFVAYGAGVWVEAICGVPAPIAGLLLFTTVLLIRPAAEVWVRPTTDVVVRWLPMLFVPLAVGGVAVVGEHSPIAIASAILVSVPVGFVVVAWVAR